MDNPAILAGSVSVAYLQGLVEYLQRQGVAPEVLLAHAQLSPEVLSQRDQRVTASAYLTLLGEGERLSGDPDLGLHLGE